MHTLRHIVSRLVARGVDIVTVQELLGHSTVTTMMRYAHANLHVKQSAVKVLALYSDNASKIAFQLAKCNSTGVMFPATYRLEEWPSG